MALVSVVALTTAFGCTSSSSKTGGSNLVPADAIAAFKKARLEVGATRPMTIEDYGLAPHVATSATRFLVPSLGADNGGRGLVVRESG